MGYLVAGIMVCLGIFLKRSRIVTCMYGLYLWVLIALNTFTADLEAYREMYLCCFEPRYALHEPGYMAICKICLCMGLSYIQFRMVVAIIIIVLLIRGLRYFTENINYALSLYLIFPFVGMVSGLRNAVGIAILIYGAHFLFQNDRNAIIKYLLCVCVAVLFHYNSVFYFCFLLLKCRRLKIIETMAGVLTGIVAVGFLMKTGILYRIVALFTQSEKVLNWFRNGSLYVSVLYILSFLCFVLLLWLLYRARMIVSLRERAGEEMNRLQSRDTVLGVSKIVCVSLLAFSGALIQNVVFLRYVLVPLPICYAVFSYAFAERLADSPEIQRECMLVRFLLPIVLVGAALFVYGYWIGGDSLHIYQNNLLFSWI